MLNDRDKVNKPNSQIGFIEFVVVPLFLGAVKLFPALYELTDNLASNTDLWEKIWEKESSPTEEEAEKVRGRVRKINEKCDEVSVSAKQRPLESKQRSSQLSHQI